MHNVRIVTTVGGRIAKGRGSCSKIDWENPRSEILGFDFIASLTLGRLLISFSSGGTATVSSRMYRVVGIRYGDV